MLVDGDERIILATDFHLGIEYELAKMGINIPYQTDRFINELMNLVKENHPDRVILLGDIKHGVPITSFQEKREIPRFFNTLLDEVENVDIIRGNHDANIQNLVPQAVEIHPTKGLVTGRRFKLSVFHGHAWPYPNFIASDLIVIGHSHPTVQLNTPLGVRITRRAWVRGNPDPVKIAEILLEQKGEAPGEDPIKTFEKTFSVEVGNPQMVIMPTFNDLMGGLPINTERPKSLLGPLFRSGAVNVDDFDVYLLDGAFLGKVEFLRTLA